MPEAGAAPLALTARDGNREVVVDANAAARSHGVRRGHTAAAARALCASLHVHAHDATADRATLEHLATALLRFTPDVALDGPRGLVLEIGRTAFHFGGEHELCRSIGDLLAGLGFAAHFGVADTPMAARALARAPRSFAKHAPGDAHGLLESLPARVLPMAAESSEACKLLGLHTVGDLARLPRASLAERLGYDLADVLARLFGERVECPPRYEAPEPFRAEIEWWPATDAQGSVLFAAKRVFDLLEAHLAASDRGALEVQVEFQLESAAHAAAAKSKKIHRLVLKPSRPAHQGRVLLDLLRHHLEAEGLPERTDALTVTLDRTAVLDFEQGKLFAAEAPSPWSEVGARLCDRLIGRLGDDRVLVADLVAEHRPERAFLYRRPAEAATAPATPPVAAPPGRRPIDLDCPPIPIDIRIHADVDVAVAADGARIPEKLFGGMTPLNLRVVRGPEHIASGWWDGQDAERRYFEVETPSGARLWIFIDEKDGRWYRHGVFG